MNQSEYEAWVIASSRRFPLSSSRKFSSNVPGLALGLAGESGEVADCVKKILRDEDGDFEGAPMRFQLLLELGDALWYLTALADALGHSLTDVMRANVEKIEARRKNVEAIQKQFPYRSTADVKALAKAAEKT